MFGLSDSKKEEMKKQVVTFFQIPCTMYFLSRKMFPEKIENCSLNKNEKKIYEAAYVLGMMTGANFFVDSDYKYITRENLKDFSNGAIKDKIFVDEVEGDQVLEKIMSNIHQEGIKNIVNLGAEQSVFTIRATLAEDGSPEKENADYPSVDYFENESMLSEFKNYCANYL